MAETEQSPTVPPHPAGQFAATRWSLVLAAAGSDPAQARAALEKLCQAYWYPLYAFVRRQGHAAHDAQDLTQAFFVRLLEKQALGQVDPAKGRFRSFLLAALKNFLANEWDKARAQKRGGGQLVVSIDAPAAESRYAVEPAHQETTDKAYERQWALSLLDEVLRQLRRAYAEAGKEALFDALKGTLTGEAEGERYAEIGRRLGLTEGAVKVAVHRLRHAYRDLLRAEIAQTVDGPREVDEELRHLVAVLSG